MGHSKSANDAGSTTSLKLNLSMDQPLWLIIFQMHGMSTGSWNWALGLSNKILCWTNEQRDYKQITPLNLTSLTLYLANTLVWHPTSGPSIFGNFISRARQKNHGQCFYIMRRKWWCTCSQWLFTTSILHCSKNASEPRLFVAHLFKKCFRGTILSNFDRFSFRWTAWESSERLCLE